MILEFIDGSQINVLNVFGGPKLVNGVLRDTLRIEVSPDTIDFNTLKNRFKDNNKCRTLYSYNNDVDEDGNNVTVRNTIGEGYNVFVSISDEERKIKCPPGKLIPDTIEEVYVVCIAQLTYEEYVAKFGRVPSNS